MGEVLGVQERIINMNMSTKFVRKMPNQAFLDYSSGGRVDPQIPTSIHKPDPMHSTEITINNSKTLQIFSRETKQHLLW